jgi:hypothetical protein
MLDRMLFIYCLTSFRRTKQHRRAWKLYDGVTVPRKEDLILVGNPDKRTSKLVYILADQADYRTLDISEIPFVTLATTRNITSAPARIDFGTRSNLNDFQFTFEVPTRSQIQARTRPIISAPSVTVAPQLERQSEPYSAIASPVAACIAAVTSYFQFTSPSGHTAPKRSREIAFEEEDRDTEANRRQCRRFGRPYTQWYKRIRVF